MPYKDPEEQRAAQRRYFEANRRSYREHQENLRRANRAWVDQLKESLPCADCGGFFPACVMDFDHREDDKVLGISAAVRSWGRDRLLLEIKKCDLVCANCHRIRTRDRSLKTEQAARVS
jgi:hypothetical protein